MSKLLLIISIGVLMAGPKAKFSEKKFDFGERRERSKVEHAFELTNTGDAPLVILKHETSCHCTSAHYPQHPILPGGTAEVVVKYDATKVGKFYRKITLFTNDGQHALVVKGEISAKMGKVNPITGE